MDTTPAPAKAKKAGMVKAKEESEEDDDEDDDEEEDEEEDDDEDDEDGMFWLTCKNVPKWCSVDYISLQRC